jgi:hypothetical protein
MAPQPTIPIDFIVQIPELEHSRRNGPGQASSLSNPPPDRRIRETGRRRKALTLRNRALLPIRPTLDQARAAYAEGTSQ